MNRELLVVGPETPAQAIRDLLRTYAVSSVPVVDSGGRPLGLVTACAVLDCAGTARERMSQPAMCIDASTDIETAARRLAAEDVHHLVVVDGAGSAVGMVSVLDVMRALVGVPAHHPGTFPHWDPVTESSWTDDWPLDASHASHAPEGPGVLVLVQPAVGTADPIVWVETSPNVRQRVILLAHRTSSYDYDAALARLLERADLCFRAAPVRDDEDRERLARRLRSDIEHRPPPGAT